MTPPRSLGRGVLDLDRLQDLAEELGSPDPALRFLTKYLSMLPERVKRISAAVEQGDSAETTISVLSLKVASSMAGAAETQAQCQAIETLIKEDLFDDAKGALTTLRHVTDACTASQHSIVAAAHASLTGPPGRFYRS